MKDYLMKTLALARYQLNNYKRDAIVGGNNDEIDMADLDQVIYMALTKSGGATIEAPDIDGVVDVEDGLLLDKISIEGSPVLKYLVDSVNSFLYDKNCTFQQQQYVWKTYSDARSYLLGMTKVFFLSQSIYPIIKMGGDVTTKSDYYDFLEEIKYQCKNLIVEKINDMPVAVIYCYEKDAPFVARFLLNRYDVVITYNVVQDSHIHKVHSRKPSEVAWFNEMLKKKSLAVV